MGGVPHASRGGSLFRRQTCPTEPAVGSLQRWLLPITVAVAVLAMLSAAGKIALTRKANPLINVGSGLALIAATSAVGVLLPAMLLRAGDAWSSWVLAQATGGQFGARLTAVLSMTGAASGVVIVLGIVAIILSAIQAVLMLFRQAALVVLAGVLPLAAAGTLAPATRAWFSRTTGWMLAFIFYKPAAAAVYATCFALLGSGNDPRTTLMGFAMLLLSLLALPALMKFFTWTTGTVEASVGGGFLSTVVSGAIAVGAVRASAGGAGGASAVDQARMVSTQLGSPGAATSPQPGGQAAGPVAAAGSGPGPGWSYWSGTGPRRWDERRSWARAAGREFRDHADGQGRWDGRDASRTAAGGRRGRGGGGRARSRCRQNRPDGVRGGPATSGRSRE